MIFEMDGAQRYGQVRFVPAASAGHLHSTLIKNQKKISLTVSKRGRPSESEVAFAHNHFLLPLKHLFFNYIPRRYIRQIELAESVLTA